MTFFKFKQKMCFLFLGKGRAGMKYYNRVDPLAFFMMVIIVAALWVVRIIKCM
jgi:hypothetical protein